MKKNTYILLRFAMGIGILGFLLWKIDLNKVIKVILTINWYILPLFVLFYIIHMFFGTLNVKILLDALDEKLDFIKLLKENWLSKSIGVFFPGRIGEISLSYLLKKYDVPYSKGIITFMVDKVISLLVIGILSIFGMFLFFDSNVAIKCALILLIILLSILCFLFLSYKARTLIKKYILRNYSKKFMGFSKNLSYLIKKRKFALLLNLISTILTIFASGAIMYVILLYFGFKIPFIYIISINAICMFSALIPISIAGLGIRESVAVYLYSLIHVEPAISAGIYLLLAFFRYLFSGIVILIYGKRSKTLKNQSDRPLK